MQIDVLVLTALKLEYDAVIDALKTITETSGVPLRNFTTRTYTLFAIPVNGDVVRVAVAAKTGMGQVDAAIATKDALRDFSPSMVLLVGIAGCAMSKESGAALGDVAVAATVHDYEMSKEQLGVSSPRWKRFDSKVSLISQVETFIDREKWATELIPSRPDKVNEGSRFHVGDVLSGNIVMADGEKTRERIREAGAKIIAVEMEAAGVMAALRSANPEPSFMMIKAFSDFAGEDKSDQSREKDRWHPYAARSAAHLAIKIIKTVLTPSYFQTLHIPRAEDLLFAELEGVVKCYLSSFGGLPAFGNEIGRQIATEAAREIVTLRALAPNDRKTLQTISNYEARLSRGTRYLHRATEAFNSASRIWAISIDSISTFWRDPEAAGLLKRYLLRTGAEKTSIVKRLFVFTRPEYAHARAELLDWHSEKMAGTFVISLENYNHLLASVLNKNSLIRQCSDTRDFALLEYDESGIQRKFVADLSDETFQVSRISEAVSSNLGRGDEYLQLFGTLSSETKTLENGQISKNFGVMAWKSGIWRDAGEWSRCLKSLFEDRTADAFHLASFPLISSEVVHEIRKILGKIKNGDVGVRRMGRHMLGNMGAEIVRMATRIPYGTNVPHDRLSGQPLNYPDDSHGHTFILMKFRDQYSLRKFMEDESHSVLRHELLYAVAKGIPELVDELGRRNILSFSEFSDGLKKDRSFAEMCFEKSRIWRLDLIEDEVIDEMVLSPPDPFTIDE